MLPVMRALQGQVLKSDAERNAVWANIEAQLTPAQLSAIANMHLTQDDLLAWTRDNGQGMGVGPGQGGPGPQGTPGPRPQGTPSAGPGQGGFRPQGTPGAGRQGMPGGPGLQGTRGVPPSFGAAAGSGRNNFLLNVLIRLLTDKLAGGAAPPSPTPTKP